MKDNLDIKKIFSEKEEVIKEINRLDKLVRIYRKETPQVNPLWDTTVDFNDINSSIIESGIEIYTAPFKDVWEGIYKPEIYDKDTLWDNIHDKRKVAKIIELWGAKKSLSPLFFVKHGKLSKALVADGKHRFTVARYMDCKKIPFMVQSNTSNWLLDAIPSAKKI